MAENLQILTATRSDMDKVMPQLTLAFATDPMMRWFLPSPQSYLANFASFALALDGRAFDHGSAFYTSDGMAGALWLPPGVQGDEEEVTGVLGEVLPEELLEPVAALGEEISNYHPKDPCWYLGYLGVDPKAQGRGLGALLLKDHLRKCDEDAVPAYLESSNPRNISLYQRHGFEIMGEINVGNPEPMTPMIRAPR